MRHALRFAFSSFLILIAFTPISRAAVPQFGAQVWIEPGQTPAEIDGWFATLESSHMPVARLFMMWSYLEPKRDAWDWSLYDAAFRSAERHHVAIVATLTPSGPPSWMGGDDSQGVGVFATEELRSAAAIYIAKVVERYKTSPALDTWLLLNEPGQLPVASELADADFARWVMQQYPNIEAVNRSWGTNYVSFTEVKGPPKPNHWNPAGEIDWTTYWRSFQTSQLVWMADEIRKHDTKHPLHLNPHALVSNLAALSDDLPGWRSFLDTLGCSIHPAWHFGLLPRDDFALGVSYVNDLVDGAIAPKPHWVTELQGGNNIHSGSRPMEPTVDDTAQWLWTSVGAGADRTIFWLLNARHSGREAGEWSLLDFDQHPSRRMEVASKIVETMQSHADFFASAKPLVPDVTLLMSLDTMTYQLPYAKPDDVARDLNQHLLELLGIYKAMAQIGPPPRIKHFDDFDWRSPGKGRVAILPDARALTAKQIENLSKFTRSGGTLLVTGLSGLYDEHGRMWALNAEQPLAEITGARFKEVHYLGPEISLPMASGTLPSRLWMSSVTPTTATAIATKDGETVATERQIPGGGRVLWIPSPVGLGAWQGNSGKPGDPIPLANYLRQVLGTSYLALPFTLQASSSSCLLRVMQSGSGYLTVLTNGSAEQQTCTLQNNRQLKGTRIWGREELSKDSGRFFAPRETVVTLWK